MRIIPIYRSRPDPSPTQYRYQLSVLDGGCGVASVRIYDRIRCLDIAVWTGEAARRIMAAGILPAELHRSGRYLAGKSFIWHLMLASAAVTADLANDYSKPLDERLAELGIELRGAKARVAVTLFDYPGQHLSRSEVQCLIGLGCPAAATRVPEYLDELVALRVISEIVVDEDNIFYDIDTRPHLHIFDPIRRELLDAPADGVVRISSRRSRATHSSRTSLAPR